MKLLRLALVSLSVAGCEPATLMMAEKPDLGSSTPAADLAGEPGPQPDLAGAPAPDLATPGPTITTLRIHYPVNGKAMALRGDTAPLDWAKGVTLTAGSDGSFTYTFQSLTKTVLFKPLLDDTTWARGENYSVRPGETVDVYPHFNAGKGTVKQLFASFSSQILSYNQIVWVYLPPGYDENPLGRYPVLYMQDGQNLFDPARAFQGNEWKVDEALDASGEQQPAPTSIRDLIVVGPEAGPNRNPNYTPTLDTSEGWGGDGDKYLRMLVEELKPQVDTMLRTIPDREHTGILGSSLGGLISAWAGCTKADTFGLVGAMSPSTWWDDTMIIDAVSQMSPAPLRPVKVYVDSGDSGQSKDDVTNTAMLAATYRTIGYVDDVSLKYVLDQGAQHSEVYWADRFPGAAQFLFGPR
jgi:predicted alpha/beta superfamily hydrolase